MLKSTYLGGIIVGLAILLATCGGLPAGESQVPAEVEMPASVENAETEAMSVEVEEPLAEEVVVPEEVADNATTDEMVNQNEKAGPAEIDADAEVATTEEEVVSEGVADVETATEVEPMLEDETVSVEEAEMSEEVADHEQSATSTEVIADEQEMMSEEAVETAQGPTEEQMQLLEGLAVLGTPSELNNEVWLNSEPLKLADLRGKVAIVEFWTFGWINCKNVIPSLREWHHEYVDDGLVIIGVHTPEFGYEREIENVKEAIVRLDVPYPVTIDNDWTTWRSYNNRYWPASYFIDKSGNIRYIHIGEGDYLEQEEIIKALLAEEVS